MSRSWSVPQAGQIQRRVLSVSASRTWPQTLQVLLVGVYRPANSTCFPYQAALYSIFWRSSPSDARGVYALEDDS